MNAGQLAALIAAGFFAVGVCAAIYLLLRLARLIATATATVTAYRDSADELIRRAHAVVDRADDQLARTGAVAESVDQVTASMSELSEQVAAVTGTARLIAVGLGAPVLRLAAAGHGVRRAIAIRRMPAGRPASAQPLIPVPTAVAARARVTAKSTAQAPALGAAQPLAEAARPGQPRRPAGRQLRALAGLRQDRVRR